MPGDKQSAPDNWLIQSHMGAQETQSWSKQEASKLVYVDSVGQDTGHQLSLAYADIWVAQKEFSDRNAKLAGKG